VPPVRRPARRPPPGHWVRFVIPEDVGVIVYDARHNSLGAHCPHHETCRMNRTCEGSTSREYQGRPLGQLVAWLLLGAGVATKQEHDRCKHNEIRLSYDSRRNAREWLAGHEGFGELFALEHAQRVGEQPEPLGLPG
jgi:hypothetical protein